MFRRASSFRTVTLWLALSAVLLRGLIPAGFMPGWTQAAEDGNRSWLMICPAGELQVLLPQSPHAHHHHHHPGMVMPAMDASAMAAMAAAPAAGGMDHSAHRIGEAHLGCPFAAAASVALPTLPVLAALSELAAEAFRPSFAPGGVIADFLRRRPSAHGPPLFS